MLTNRKHDLAEVSFLEISAMQGKITKTITTIESHSENY